MPARGLQLHPYVQFYKAARKRDRTTVVRLIREHPELHDFEGRAGDLLSILDREAPELIELAFAAGLSPDSGEGAPHITFLQAAACRGDLDRVHLALRYGADLERRNNVGELALAYACSWGQLEVVQFLVEAGAQINAVEEDPNSGYRCTALDCTASHPEVARFLRSRGALHLNELEPCAA